MTTEPSRDLTRALTEYAAQIPVPVSRRLAAAFAEVTASGAAPGLAVGEQAFLFSLPDATGQMVELGHAAIGPLYAAIGARVFDTAAEPDRADGGYRGT